MSGLNDRLRVHGRGRLIHIGKLAVSLDGVIKLSAYMAVLLWSLVAWAGLFRLMALWQ